MAQTGFTPIQLYSSSTPTNAPSAGNLTNDTKGSELAINIADKNLFFKDSTNAVNTVPIRQSGAASDGWLSSTDWNTFNGKAPAVTYTTNYIPYGQGTTTPNQSAGLQYNGTTFTTTGISTSNNLAFTGTGNRITGDFTNATLSNRALFQTNTANSATVVGAIPSGTGTSSQFRLFNNSDPNNSGGVRLFTTSGSIGLEGLAAGTGTQLPMTFSVGGSERARIFTSGGVSIGNTTDPGAGNLSVTGDVQVNSTNANSTENYFYQTSPAFTSGSVSKVGYYSDSGTKNFGLGWLSDSGGSQGMWINATNTDIGIVMQTNAANGVRLAVGGTSWSSYSDERLKTIVEPITNAKQKLKMLRTVIGRYNTDNLEKRRPFFIAQDMQKALPEAVDNETDFLEIRYSDTLPLLAAAINELIDDIEKINTKLGI